jgi:hypothetical protein
MTIRRRPRATDLVRSLDWDEPIFVGGVVSLRAVASTRDLIIADPGDRIIDVAQRLLANVPQSTGTGAPTRTASAIASLGSNGSASPARSARCGLGRRRDVRPCRRRPQIVIIDLSE